MPEKPNSKTRVSQKSKTLSFERGNNVQNGTIQNAYMFDHLRSTYCFKGITWSDKRTFCYRYYCKENLDVGYWWPFYSNIFMNFAKTMTIVREMED
jgi:hypothetical protein